MIVLGNCRGETNNIILYSRLRGKIVVIHNDPANYDTGDISPNLYCVENNINKSLLKQKSDLNIFKPFPNLTFVKSLVLYNMTNFLN